MISTIIKNEVCVIHGSRRVRLIIQTDIISVLCMQNRITVIVLIGDQNQETKTTQMEYMNI